MHIEEHVRVVEESLPNDGGADGQVPEDRHHRVQRHRELDILQGNGVRVHKVSLVSFLPLVISLVSRFKIDIPRYSIT